MKEFQIAKAILMKGPNIPPSQEDIEEYLGGKEVPMASPEELEEALPREEVSESGGWPSKYTGPPPEIEKMMKEFEMAAYLLEKQGPSPDPRDEKRGWHNLMREGVLDDPYNLSAGKPVSNRDVKLAPVKEGHLRTPKVRSTSDLPPNLQQQLHNEWKEHLVDNETPGQFKDFANTWMSAYNEFVANMTKFGKITKADAGGADDPTVFTMQHGKLHRHGGTGYGDSAEHHDMGDSQDELDWDRYGPRHPLFPDLAEDEWDAQVAAENPFGLEDEENPDVGSDLYDPRNREMTAGDPYSLKNPPTLKVDKGYGIGFFNHKHGSY